jgi:hypothetical protein
LGVFSFSRLKITLSRQALVNAETKDHLEFAVRLWDDKHQVVVEVQRSCGCSFLFHQTAKAVLRASKGSSSVVSSHPLFALPNCIPRETDQERMDCLKDGLDIAATLLLKGDTIDAHVMAVQSLVHLSKVCKCKGYAAEAILGNSEILSALLSLIESSSMSSQSSLTRLSELEEEHVGLMRCEALCLFANCLCSLKQHDKLHEMLSRQEDLVSDNFIAVLIDQVGSAEEQPHQACQAVKCLLTLTEASAKVRRRALDLGMDSAASLAMQHGMCRHSQLHECSEQLRLSINASNEHL